MCNMAAAGVGLKVKRETHVRKIHPIRRPIRQYDCLIRKVGSLQTSDRRSGSASNVPDSFARQTDCRKRSANDSTASANVMMTYWVWRDERENGTDDRRPDAKRASAKNARASENELPISLCLDLLGGAERIVVPACKVGSVCLKLSHCGVRGSSTQGPSSQIVGGEDAAPLEFPWQVLVERTDSVIHICGGSVINKEYIITAAHCTSTNSTPSSYTVTVEKYHSDQQDPNERQLAVSEVTTHPKWVSATLEYDYALLKLETPLDFSGVDKNVMPICLPEKDQTFENQTCTATGWGTTVNDGQALAPILQKVDLPIISFEECSQLIASVDNEDAMICGNYKDVGKSTCS
ncbi:hypothetical protein HPB47_003619, partial [Ixodes persulcatus]